MALGLQNKNDFFIVCFLKARLDLLLNAQEVQYDIFKFGGERVESFSNHQFLHFFFLNYKPTLDLPNYF